MGNCEKRPGWNAFSEAEVASVLYLLFYLNG